MASLLTLIIDRYVLRLILRRAIRYGDEKLGAKPGFFASLAPIVQQTLGTHFTELTDEKIAWVQEVLNEEEAAFRKTLRRGTRIFQKMTADAKDGVISGDTAWRLYSTYGFPVDLTIAMAEEKGMKINMEEYEAAKKQAALDSEGAGGDKKGGVDMDVNAIGDLTAKSVPATNDSAKYVLC